MRRARGEPIDAGPRPSKDRNCLARTCRGGALVLAITLAAVRADAHVAPSVDDNNRYLKLTPLGDRVRLAYTVFFGEVPGARMRRSIDSNRDGSISDAEGHVFGKKLAAEVAAALDVNVDGGQRAITWSQISVGMGSPRTVAGAFSVDLVAYFCLPTARGRHELTLFDRFKLLRPGETEVRIEDGPGITIDRVEIGSAVPDATRNFRFVGPGGPLTEDGVSLAFTAGDQAAVTADAICSAKPARRGLPTGLVVGSAAVLGFVLAGAVVLVRRRRQR